MTDQSRQATGTISAPEPFKLYLEDYTSKFFAKEKGGRTHEKK